MHFLYKTFPGTSEKTSHCAKLHIYSCLIYWLPKTGLCEITECSPPLRSKVGPTIHQTSPIPKEQAHRQWQSHVWKIFRGKLACYAGCRRRPFPTQLHQLAKSTPSVKFPWLLNHWWDFDALRYLESSWSLWNSLFLTGRAIPNYWSVAAP